MSFYNDDIKDYEHCFTDLDAELYDAVILIGGNADFVLQRRSSDERSRDYLKNSLSEITIQLDIEKEYAIQKTQEYHLPLLIIDDEHPVIRKNEMISFIEGIKKC